VPSLNPVTSAAPTSEWNETKLRCISARSVLHNIRGSSSRHILLLALQNLTTILKRCQLLFLLFRFSVGAHPRYSSMSYRLQSEKRTKSDFTPFNSLHTLHEYKCSFSYVFELLWHAVIDKRQRTSSRMSVSLFNNPSIDKC
jgi:hypothetical protein